MVTAGMLLEKIGRIDIQTSAELAMEETSSDAVKAQKNQLHQGIDKTGEFITNQETGSNQYSPSYAKYKGRKGPIDLKDFGDYYSGIGIEIGLGDFTMFSTDEKAPMLNKRYNPLGLGSDARIEWIKTLKFEFVKQIKKQMQ